MPISCLTAASVTILEKMNNRDYKGFTEGECYHVYNRGVGKMDIFLCEEDFNFFISRLRENLFPSISMNKSAGGYRRELLPFDSYSLIAYCLMPNHFHLLIRQNKELPISKLLSKIGTSYSKYFNKKYIRVGSLFQDQFKAVHIENNEQLLWVTTYIHQNPKVAKLVSTLDDYPFSSYLDYVGMRKGTLCSKELILNQFNNETEHYRSCVENSTEEAVFTDLRIDDEKH